MGAPPLQAGKFTSTNRGRVRAGVSSIYLATGSWRETSAVPVHLAKALLGGLGVCVSLLLLASRFQDTHTPRQERMPGVEEERKRGRGEGAGERGGRMQFRGRDGAGTMRT